MQDQDFTIKFIGGSYFLYAKDIHQIWCRSAKFLRKSKFCSEPGSGWGSWYKFCLDPLTPSKFIVSTWKVHVRTYIQTDRQTEIFFGLFCLLRHKNHEHLSKGENFFFFHSCDYNTFSFSYSVCDEKVKRFYCHGTLTSKETRISKKNWEIL